MASLAQSMPLCPRLGKGKMTLPVVRIAPTTRSFHPGSKIWESTVAFLNSEGVLATESPRTPSVGAATRTAIETLLASALRSSSAPQRVASEPRG